MIATRRFASCLAAAAMLGVCAAAPADYGTAEQAKAMLAKAVIALKADEPAALKAFSAGAGGFRDRDLYVFCARTDGRVDAHVDPQQIGRNMKDVYDIDGVAFGQEIMSVAREGVLTGVSYMWPTPGTLAPVQKITFVTRVADQVCGVGYYK